MGGRDQGRWEEEDAEGVTVTPECAQLSWSAWLCNSYYHERKARAPGVPAANVLTSVIHESLSDASRCWSVMLCKPKSALTLWHLLYCCLT